MRRFWGHLGGTGDTGLFKDTRGGPDVAIKLIRRPLPKVIMPNILREVTVRDAAILTRRKPSSELSQSWRQTVAVIL